MENPVRRVRCPRCLNVLEEPRAAVYQCGGCGTTLRAKIRITDTGSAGDAARASPSRKMAQNPAGYFVGRPANYEDKIDAVRADYEVVPVPTDVEDTDERTNNQAKRKEKKEQQRKQYMIWRVCFSLVGHSILFALSFMSGHDGGVTSIKWLNWGVTELIAPVLLLGAMIMIQALYIDLEDISEDKDTVKRCKRVNLATISISKIVYFAIREAPVGANVTGRAIAHAIAFVIDMVGAIYLYRNHSCLEQDNV